MVTYWLTEVVRVKTRTRVNNIKTLTVVTTTVSQLLLNTLREMPMRNKQIEHTFLAWCMPTKKSV